MFKLRPVNSEDKLLLFGWTNDMEVRNNSISTRQIELSEHSGWFDKRLARSDNDFFILEKDETPVGQIRFDFDTVEKIWIINYSIAKEFRGMGLGKFILQNSLKEFKRGPVWGYVKPENTASLAIFAALGFENAGNEIKKGVSLVKFIKQSNDA